MIRHVKQSTNYSCGAASLAIVLGISEREAAYLAKTKKSGTYTGNVCNALREKHLKFKNIYLDLPIECIFAELKLLSNQYPIYCSGEFVNNSGRGRNGIRRHAFVLNREKVYDPGQKNELDIECIHSFYNRELIIKEIVLVGIND